MRKGYRHVSTQGPSTTGDFGANEWLVDEMYERWQSDPTSVDPAWDTFFTDYRRRGETGPPSASARAEPDGRAPVPGSSLVTPVEAAASATPPAQAE